MEQFATEEQQVEAIKQFWKQHGTVILLGTVLGLGGLVGWRYYSDIQLKEKEAASTAYEDAVKTMDESDDINALSQYIANNKGSGYADIAALVAAQTAVSKGDLSAGVTHLTTAINNTSDAHLAGIAGIRKARIQLAMDEFDAALTTLEQVKGESFISGVEEVKGDVYAAQGKVDLAKIAYGAALESARNNRLLQMKLDNLSAKVGS